MNFDFKSQGWSHKFRLSSNELIIECYNYDDYHIDNIRLILNTEERNYWS